MIPHSYKSSRWCNNPVLVSMWVYTYVMCIRRCAIPTGLQTLQYTSNCVCQRSALRLPLTLRLSNTGDLPPAWNVTGMDVVCTYVWNREGRIILLAAFIFLTQAHGKEAKKLQLVCIIMILYGVPEYGYSVCKRFTRGGLSIMLFA